MKEYSFNPIKFLGARENPSKIYAHFSNGLLFSPFNLVLYQWERLLLVNFEGDPQYNIIELQSINNESGKGAVVILYQKDGKVNVYYSKNIKISRDMYHWGSNWEIIGETEIEYTFEISEKGLDAYLKMKDRFNRVLEFRVKENNQNVEYQNILAPMGFNEAPEFFPFMYLKKFTPVIYEGTEIKIVIDGKERKPAKIPVKINGRKRYLTRYSDDPILGLWNIRYNNDLKPLKNEMIRENKSYFNGIEYTFKDNAGYHEIAKICSKSEDHKIYFQFSPPIPDLYCLKDEFKAKGKLVAGVDNNDGVMGGEYSIQRSLNKVKITIHPTKGFQPIPGKLWFTAYSWLADLEIHSDEVTIESSWNIKKGIFNELFRKK